MGEGDRDSLEYTPTWIVAVVCAVMVFISVLAERGLHRLGKCLKQKHQDALFEALQKLKEELMLLGFISLLLTVFQGFISRICIPEHLSSYMLPCKIKDNLSHENDYGQHSHSTLIRRRLQSVNSSANRCALKGKAALMSVEALHQLHIFIFVLAVAYVTSSAITMVLGGMKVRTWKHWEDSMRREFSKAQNESSRLEQIHARHHHKFKQRASRYSSLSWMISFLKQFYGSLTKSDYIALRLGFIMTHCPKNHGFDFHKYMMRTLEIDFKKVVGVSWYLWAFVVLFLLVNLKGWHTYFWLSFLPLILLVLVGAKLEHIITSLAEEIELKTTENSGEKNDGEVKEEGEPWVKPSDKHFWFGRPHLVLYLIHFILFQNSFETAFLFWVMYTYGTNSCIIDRVGFIIPRLLIGVIVQVLCSYSTLPLYTIVTQMGSNFKQGIFEHSIHNLVEIWAGDSRVRASMDRNEMQRMSSELSQVGLEAQELDDFVEGSTQAPRELPLEIHGTAAF
ncbi:hypothetical protein Droror1_Dr00014072 [Drosera rotundifolia]